MSKKWIRTAANAFTAATSTFQSSSTILLFHRVSSQRDPLYPPMPPQDFAEYCEFLAARFHVIPLHELMERVQRKQSLHKYCALTFDDGYKDFETDSYPVLKKYNLPVTHFLVADCVQSGRPTWNLRLKRILAAKFAQTPDSIRQPEMKRLTAELALMDRESKYEWLEKQEQESPNLEPAPLMLREQDLKAFDPKLVSWGSHTLSHAMLKDLNSTQIQKELQDSRHKLGEMTGSEIRYLAYPNGIFSEEVMRIAQTTGYQKAFAVGQQRVTHHTPDFAVGRFDTYSRPLSRLGLETSGVANAIRKTKSLLRGQVT
jgi:peptidoglycan/xylan/chitin deacetylase (PgdA/CDA1 family)